VNLRLATDEDDRELESVIMASIANYVHENGARPEAAILVLIGEDGSNSLTYCRAAPSDFAFAAARLLHEATAQ
jgi:hypothetical protein